MPPLDLSDLFGAPRESKRYSHGQHLTPQDAHTDRTRRRRHKHSSDDQERRRRSSDRGYRSDNEPRRRHGDDHEKERHRASSSRRSKEKEQSERHRKDSDSDSDEDDPPARSAPHRYEHHLESDDNDFLRRRMRSKEQSYGDHRYDDVQDERHKSRFSFGFFDELMPQKSTAALRHSEKEIYGEHRLEYPAPFPPLVYAQPPRKRSPDRSRGAKYGEHRLDDRKVTSSAPPPGPAKYSLPAEPLLAYPAPLPPSPLSSSKTNVADNVHHMVSQDDGRQVPNTSPPPNHRQTANHMSLPSRAQDMTFDSGNRSPQEHYGSHPSMSGHGLTSPEPFPEAQPPRLSVSQYPSDYIKSLSNVVTPGDSRSEAGNYMERPRLGSAPSTTSSAILSQSPSLSGSGVLGPRTYQYQPLRDYEFRLVRILPERMWKLKCEILHVSLGNAPDYTAISYAWGDGVDTRSLVLEGATIPVAVSLHDALRAVRRRKEEALVWVDALCIDQQNKVERATQVRLMGHIYSRAISVAIWLGPELDESELALQLLQKVAENSVDPQRIKSIHKYADSAALFNLFKRDYWKRLWVVQEVLLANNKMVYCGYQMFPWEVYRQAAEVFWDKDSDPHIRQGPSSFPDRDTLAQLGDESLLEVMRACRKKLSENPRDKVFGILGMLPEATQREFPVDYSQSVKTVYIDVVDYLISTTDQLDVIRESIHFPLHVNSTGLPTWCPDWSHVPEVSGLSRTLNFAASRGADGPTKAQYRFHDERRKLEISAIKLDAIMATGVAVGTFCASQDYLTAFLQWRAVLLHELNIEEGNESHPMHKAFCRTLCLGQVPKEWSSPQVWHDLSHHVFASLIREKIPRLRMDEDLRLYADATGLIKPDARRKFLQDHFGNRMMGRSFCITEEGQIGMGSGYMTAGDLVVVPFGCSTPILLRPEGRQDEYRYVGDVYIDGYMDGEAVAEMEAKDPKRVVSKYKLC